MSGNGWLEIEVTELLAGNGEEKISFQVECFSLDMTKTLSFEQVGIVTNGPNRPFLVAKRRKNFKRIKRQGDERLPESNEDEEDLGPSPAELDDQSRACEAVPIYYKFDDYGWDVSNFVSPLLSRQFQSINLSRLSSELDHLTEGLLVQHLSRKVLVSAEKRSETEQSRNHSVVDAADVSRQVSGALLRTRRN